MELILDFGNTNKKLALFSCGKLMKLEQYPEIGPMIIRDFFRRHPGIEATILSSVIHHPDSINRFLGSKTRFIELTHKTPVPLKNLYRTPDTLGKDRLAAAVSGNSRFPGNPVLVVNCGTCITYDVVDNTGSYHGGAISPGIHMRLEALHTFTGKLPLVKLIQRSTLTGKTTAESILAGTLTAAVSEVDGMIARYREEYPGLKVILSGGEAKYFAKRLKSSIFALPNIVIHGLHQILLFNVDR